MAFWWAMRNTLIESKPLIERLARVMSAIAGWWGRVSAVGDIDEGGDEFYKLGVVHGCSEGRSMDEGLCMLWSFPRTNSPLEKAGLAVLLPRPQ